jgi:inositol transport system substrate-binding protein
MMAQARTQFDKTKKKINVFHLIGDLGDPNAIYRKEGFEKALSEAQDIIGKVIEVPTEWDANIALNNLRSALQAEPDIGMLFCGSDFIYPQIQAALEPLGKWKKIGEEGHVIMGAVDGDSTAGRLMDEGYVDATAVQDVYYEATLTLNTLVKAINENNGTPDEWLDDPGFALTQENMKDRRIDMWGNKVRRARGEIQ